MFKLLIFAVCVTGTAIFVGMIAYVQPDGGGQAALLVATVTPIVLGLLVLLAKPEEFSELRAVPLFVTSVACSPVPVALKDPVFWVMVPLILLVGLIGQYVWDIAQRWRRRRHLKLVQ